MEICAVDRHPVAFEHRAVAVKVWLGRMLSMYTCAVEHRAVAVKIWLAGKPVRWNLMQSRLKIDWKECTE